MCASPPAAIIFGISGASARPGPHVAPLVRTGLRSESGSNCVVTWSVPRPARPSAIVATAGPAETIVSIKVVVKSIAPIATKKSAATSACVAVINADVRGSLSTTKKRSDSP